MLIPLLRRQPERASYNEQRYAIKPGRCQNQELALLYIFSTVSETIETQQRVLQQESKGSPATA